MDFSFTDEQRMLQDVAARFVADRAGQSGDPWPAMVGMGWAALRVPEAAGGLGWSPVEAAVLMEELGRGVVLTPILDTAIIAVSLLVAAGRDEALAAIVEGSARIALALEEEQTRWSVARTTTRLSRDGAGWRLSGHKILVADAAAATGFLLAARDENGGLVLVLVPNGAEGLALRPYDLIDGRPAADLTLDEVALSADALVLGADAALPALEAALDEARVLMAAEAVGVMEAAFALARDYLGQRKQFGRRLEEFQALTHRLADMRVMVENARAMVYRGLSLLGAAPPTRAAAVSATMIAVGQAAEMVCAQAVQLHGGIGMTREYAVNRHYRRTRAMALTWGDRAMHLARYRAGSGLATATASQQEIV